jgi:hypothetical protein
METFLSVDGRAAGLPLPKRANSTQTCLHERRASAARRLQRNVRCRLLIRCGPWVAALRGSRAASLSQPSPQPIAPLLLPFARCHRGVLRQTLCGSLPEPGTVLLLLAYLGDVLTIVGP